MRVIVLARVNRQVRPDSLLGGVQAARRVVPDVFEAVLPLITGSDSAVRTPAMTTAAYCLDHPALGDRKDALAELLADTAPATFRHALAQRISARGRHIRNAEPEACALL
jgi:hypothetical protein